jgi:hypothetical protein
MWTAVLQTEDFGTLDISADITYEIAPKVKTEMLIIKKVFSYLLMSSINT